MPDVRGGSLAVTPIVAGDAANGPRRPDVPFIFGRTTITPAVSPRFSRDGSISVAFRVYNWTAKADEEKPDLTVEYLFYEQGTKGLHFFNKVKPQQLTAATLGTAFDPSAGSVAAGMLIPLEAFTLRRLPADRARDGQPHPPDGGRQAELRGRALTPAPRAPAGHRSRRRHNSPPARFTESRNPGIPSGGLFVVTAPVMLSVGLPLEGIALLIAADSVPDVFATMVNVTGDMGVAALVAEVRRA